MFVSHPLIKGGKFEARKYQVEIAKKAIKDNTLVVLPTGLGKTNIALLVCAELLNKEDGKILFLSPTKPLIEQHKKTFEKLSEICDLEVVSGYIKPENRGKLYKKARIVFATPQTISNDLKNRVLELDDFILLVVDEAHHTIGNYAYTYITRRYVKESKKPLILGMTASPGGKITKIEEIKKNLFINQVEFRNEIDESIKEYVKEKEINKIDVILPEDYKTAKKLIEKIIERKVDYLVKIGALPTRKISRKLLLNYHLLYLKKVNTLKRKELYFAISKIAELIKLDYCLELLETQGNNQTLEYIKKLESEKTKAAINILSDKEFNIFIEKIKRLEIHPKIKKLKKIVEKEFKNKIIIFTQYRVTINEIKQEIKNIEGVKIGVLIGQRSGLNQKKQISIIRDFEEGIYNVLLCTSIGEEGLDIKGVGSAIFYEPIPSEIRNIQRRGRVGRLIKGNIYILVAKNTRDDAYYWTAYHKEKKMRKYLERNSKQTIL
jgi:Fanconi anemia group M protein